MTALETRNLLSQLADYALKSRITPNELIDAVHREMIMQALDLEGGNQCRAAKRLGMHRNTLRRNMQELNIELPGHNHAAHILIQDAFLRKIAPSCGRCRARKQAA
jgi:DNA-binding NtrC family response regulator